MHGTVMGEGSEALAVYGSLRPGGANHWVINRIAGEWRTGTVDGWQFEITWGPAEGYDGFIADTHGSHVEVDVLISDHLHKKWREIDDFEGPGYRRIAIEVVLDDGSTMTAQIYETLADS